MNKIFLIFFTFLFFNSSVSYSKIITLKDCYTDVKGYKSFDKNVYEDYKFVIDTNKNIVTLIYVWTDNEIKKQLEQVETIIKKKKDYYFDEVIKFKDIQFLDNYIFIDTLNDLEQLNKINNLLEIF